MLLIRTPLIRHMVSFVPPERNRTCPSVLYGRCAQGSFPHSACYHGRHRYYDLIRITTSRVQRWHYAFRCTPSTSWHVVEGGHSLLCLSIPSIVPLPLHRESSLRSTSDMNLQRECCLRSEPTSSTFPVSRKPYSCGWSLRCCNIRLMLWPD